LASGRGRAPVAFVFALLPLGAVFFAFVLPYAAALTAGLGGSATGYSALRNPALLRLVSFTAWQAGLSVLLALALGLPGAWFIGSGRLRPSSPVALCLRSITGIPFAMPPILVVLAFVLFFGNSGWANRGLAALGGMAAHRGLAAQGLEEGPLRILYRPSAIILAHGFYNFPLVIRLAGDGLAQARKAYAPAAASLGASPFMAAVTVLFPLVLPSIVSAALLVFLYSFTSFAVALVLGGGPAATTLAVEIYRYARVSLDFHNAGALALMETLVAVLVFVGYLFFQSRIGGALEIRDRPLDERPSPGASVVLGVYILALGVFILGPLLSVPLESLLYQPSRAAPVQLSLRWWSSLGDRIVPALARTALLASLSATLSCCLATLAAAAVQNLQRANPGGKSPLAVLVRSCSVAPLFSSAIVLGFGWLILYGRDHSGGLPAAAVLHAITALPFAFNSISRGLESIPRNTANAAALFGADPLRRVVTVDIPLTLGRLRSAWGFSAVISMGELNAVMMLGLEDYETLPLLIYRAVGSYRYGTACAAGTVLILACVAAFLISDAGTRKGGTGGA
jgi:thiamine transport system permease protein